MDFGPGLLHAAIVESPHGYARIISIDTSEAEAVDGVVRIVTGKDFPYTFGMYMEDRYIFAQDHVRFVGEQVAAVIARSHRQAVQAAKLVEVEYEVLRPLLDPKSAVADDAELIHPDLADYTHVPWFFPEADTNIAHWRKIRKGDTEKAFAEADYVLEDTYHVPRLRPLRHRTARDGQPARPGEPAHGVDGLAVAVHAARTCSPRRLRRSGSRHKDVRVITPYVGGGFGGKAGVCMEIIGAALATVVKGRPVKLRWTREQEFYNTYQRQGVVAESRSASRTTARSPPSSTSSTGMPAPTSSTAPTWSTPPACRRPDPTGSRTSRMIRSASTPTFHRAARTAGSATPSSTSASSPT